MTYAVMPNGTASTSGTGVRYTGTNTTMSEAIAAKAPATPARSVERVTAALTAGAL